VSAGAKNNRATVGGDPAVRSAPPVGA
jgi:hypothetical protein